jgi:hypothetical protein
MTTLFRRSIRVEGEMIVVKYSDGRVLRISVLRLAEQWRDLGTSEAFFSRYLFDWPFHLVGDPLEYIEKRGGSRLRRSRVPTPQPQLQPQRACVCGHPLLDCPKCHRSQVFCRSCGRARSHSMSGSILPCI